MHKHILSAAFTLSVFSLWCAPAAAQSVFMKIGGGFTTQSGAAGHIAAAKIGFGYEHEFNQKLAFAPSIGAVGRGWQIKDVDTPDLLFDAQGNVTGQRPVLDADGNHVDGQFMWSRMHRSYTMNYLQLDLPFNYYCRVGECRYVTLTAGPWLAVGVAGRRTTEGDGTQADERKVRYTDSAFSLDGAHRFDCGLKAGIGYQFPSSLTINVEGELGLLKTNKATADFGNRSGRNAALMLTLSYKLNKSTWKAND